MTSHSQALDEMYQENILDHYQHPHNNGPLSKYTLRHREHNPSCGDDVEIFLATDGYGIVTGASFVGRGCAVSIAAVSMLTDFIKGKNIEEVRRLGQEDIMKLLGISVGPSRLKCALLGLKTLEKGIALQKQL